MPPDKTPPSTPASLGLSKVIPPFCSGEQNKGGRRQAQPKRTSDLGETNTTDHPLVPSEVAGRLTRARRAYRIGVASRPASLLRKACSSAPLSKEVLTKFTVFGLIGVPPR